MSKEYNQYLQEHRANVAAAYYWIKENTPELLIDDDYERQITSAHDKSKSDADEYDDYDAYFYGPDQSYDTKVAFNNAWLNHIHKNKHHWQYWVLNNDDPQDGEVLIEIPYNYVIEMVCDWWSFGFKQNDLSSLFQWYNDHKNYIKINDNTRNQLEYILEKINKKLNEK